jgi:5'-3' exonuclease
VPPDSIADYLALVGDSADGYPGLPGWGAKSAATVLAKFGSIEGIPASSGDWGLPALRGAEKLARTLQDQLAEALLFKVIATTALDVPVGHGRRVACGRARHRSWPRWRPASAPTTWRNVPSGCGSRAAERSAG